MRWPWRRAEALLKCRIRGRAWRSWRAIPAAAEKEIAQAPAELVQARTVKLGAITSKPVSARFNLVFDSSPRPERAEFVDGDESLRAAGEQLREKDFPVRFPDVSSVKIVRRGRVELRRLGMQH